MATIQQRKGTVYAKPGVTVLNTREMDWEPFPGLEGAMMKVLSEDDQGEPLVFLIKRLLAPEGLCLLTDQDRIPSAALRETMIAQELEFTTQAVRAGEPGGRRVKGSLYRIRHRS